MSKHLIVIGGGASGFFCAVNAARMSPGLHVTLVEKTGKLLSKVRVSGGGRCNVTHALYDIGEMSARYPRGQHFVKKTFHQFFTTDTIKWFQERGVPLKTEPDGRMFPVSDSSESILNCLLNESRKYRVDVRLHAEVAHIQKNDTAFQLTFADGSRMTSDYVCIATGGYPKASMFRWLQETGHTIATPVPSLFTFNLPQHPITQLMGVSVDLVRIKIEGSKLVEQGPLLITHWGLSGPSVLRLSAWGTIELMEKNYDFNAHINWLPNESEQALKELLRRVREEHASKKLSNHNLSALPNRLWQFLLQQSGISEEVRLSNLPAKAENLLVRNLTDYVVHVKGKTTFKEEFVTAGGVNLNEVDANTLMSKLVPDLFFAGEALNIDGITGGFNFQNAWTTAFIAAKTVARLASA